MTGDGSDQFFFEKDDVIHTYTHAHIHTNL